ncbi:MAG TPA: glycosyltransferase [Candidatus Limnocylindrales bacterium]|nr:glycosyltransferase [Candidatus Limnocylindrales bacterium]
MARLEPVPLPDLPPTRVVIDLRPLQEPERMPITAEYLGRLTQAFAADPLPGESFVTIARTMRADPSQQLEQQGLAVEGRRLLPPTGKVLRSAGLTLDSFLLRGAEVGTRGAVYHSAGGATPLASRLPLVATVLDLAPWELPNVYAATPAARFGHRLRARILQDAARLIVCSRATGDAARRLLHVPEARVAVVPLAVDDDFREAGRDRAMQAALRRRFGLPERYLVFGGRYDARKDMATFLAALSSAGAGAEDGPFVALAGRYDASSDQAALQRAVDRARATSRAVVLPDLSRTELAALVGGATGFVYPALSEATGLPVLEALSVGVPVICSRAGALPEQVGGAGVIVEPRDPRRMASAIDALWAGGPLAEQIRGAARRRAEADERRWRDVARETRQVYADAARASVKSPPT